MQQYESIDRKNLFAADNQQGRPMELEPSTTIRTTPEKKRTIKDSKGYYFNKDKCVWMRIITDTEAYCNNCNSFKPLNDFVSTKGKLQSNCKACRKLIKAANRYEISQKFAAYLYSINQCECCGCEFEKETHKHIHHTETGVKGIVCLYCNHVLRDCSTEHLRRLQCCVEFIKQDEDRV